MKCNSCKEFKIKCQLAGINPIGHLEKMVQNSPTVNVKTLRYFFWNSEGHFVDNVGCDYKVKTQDYQFDKIIETTNKH